MDKPIIARREVTNHILHTFKLKADKRLGQNFLIDSKYQDAIEVLNILFAFL